jgi:hypothetical protein
MLSHIYKLRTLEPPQRIIPKPQDTCLYVFPNCTNGALMCVECPIEVGPEVELLLLCAHVQRNHSCLPSDVIPTFIAARIIGISQSTLRRWVIKGWIRAWSKQAPINPDYSGPWNEGGNNDLVHPVTSGYFFSEREAQAYRLAKPRDL